jgi:hypothetical protein
VADSPPTDAPRATAAARLRALPQGSLARRAEAVQALQLRLRDLRARIAPPPPGP